MTTTTSKPEIFDDYLDYPSGTRFIRTIEVVDDKGKVIYREKNWKEEPIKNDKQNIN